MTTHVMATILHPARRTVQPEVAQPRYGTEFATGEADGASCRAANGALSKYVLVGQDEYARGYRAGYFRRGAGTSREAGT